jgi:hypothetical protein
VAVAILQPLKSFLVLAWMNAEYTCLQILWFVWVTPPMGLCKSKIVELLLQRWVTPVAMVALVEVVAANSVLPVRTVTQSISMAYMDSNQCDGLMRSCQHC